MNKRQWDTVLYGIAEDQAGYFTAAQARSAGLHQVRLVQLAQQGDIERVSRGVYRFARFPVSRHGHFMDAVLWPQVRRPDVAGVVSHESALAIHGLSDVNPTRVHITLPAAVRIRRQVPKGLVIHYADLAPEAVERVGGVPVTARHDARKGDPGDSRRPPWKRVDRAGYRRRATLWRPVHGGGRTTSA